MFDQEDREGHIYHREGSTIVFEKAPSEEETWQQKRELEQHEFARRQVRLNGQMAVLNGFLVLATFCGTGIALWQAHISQIASNAARDAVRTAEQSRKDAEISSNASSQQAARAFDSSVESYHSQQRSYLVPGDPEETGGYGLLRFPITNYGRVSAKRVTTSVHFARFQITPTQPKSILLDRRVQSVASNVAIPPSEKPSFYMMVFIPQNDASDYSVALASGQQSIMARGTITYDSGFGQQDSITWCYNWQPRHAKWENCGGSASSWLDSVPNTVNGGTGTKLKAEQNNLPSGPRWVQR